MKRFQVLAMALLLLTVGSAIASDIPKLDVNRSLRADINKSWNFNLSYPTRVGTALLPSGDYTVQHIKEGEQHFLVFKSGKKAMARVACTMEPLPEKADATSDTVKRTDAGERVLMNITFQGDAFQHDLVNP